MNSSEKIKGKKKSRLKRLIHHKIMRNRNILPLLALVLTIILSISILGITFIPKSFTMIVTISLILIIVLCLVLINVHKKIPVKVLGYFLLAIVFVFNTGLMYAINETKQFLENSFNSDNKHYQTTYYLLTKPEYAEEEVSGTVLYLSNMANKEEATSKIKNKYSVTYKEYKKLENLLTNMDDESRYILLDKSLYSNITKNGYYGITTSSYKIVYEYDIYEKMEINYKSPNDKFNVLVEILDENGISKYNNLLTVNLSNKKITTTIIPKDSYIELSSKEEFDKLENMSIYSNEEPKKSIERLLDTKIDYQVRINENGFISVLKKLKVKYNEKKITGKEDLEVIIEDNNLLEVLESLYNNSIKQYNLKEYTEVINLLNNAYDTNISKELINKIISNQLNKKGMDIDKYEISGIISKDKVLQSDIEDEVLVLDSKKVQKVSSAISKTLN